MKYISTLIAVKDIQKSKQFYHDVLGLEVISDLGANVTLTGGFALHWTEHCCIQTKVFPGGRKRY